MNDTQEQTLSTQLLTILPLFARTVTAELRQLDSPLAMTHLGILSKLCEGSCNISELAEEQAVSLPSMSGTIGMMERQGWIARARSKQDRRMVLIEVTPSGVALLESIFLKLSVTTDNLLHTLSNEEKDALSGGIKVLHKIFAKEQRVQEQRS